MATKKKSVLYARYSSQNQREESIARQIEKIESFCQDNNLEIVEQYIDEAQSGTTDQRDNFQKMIDDAPNSDWDFIVVYKLDRLSRSVSDTMHYKKQMNQMGIRILSVIEDFDEATPEGGFFNLITMGISEFYSKNLAREAFAGQLQNAKRAMHTGGIQPLGFKHGKNLNIYINQKEAEAVRFIFKKTLEGWSYADIARKLNKEGYKNQQGRNFRPIFTDMLQNRKYIGEYVYNRSAKKNIDGTRNSHKNKAESDIVRIPNAIPAIIDKDTFDNVQALLKRRKHKNLQNGPKSKYLLTGLLFCEHCGYRVSGNISYSGRSKYQRIAYRCKTKKGEKCNLKDINTIYMDRFVTQKLLELLSEKSTNPIKESINTQLEALKINLKEKIKSKEQELEETETMTKVLANKTASASKNIDKVLTEQMQEYSDQAVLLRTEMKELKEDYASIQEVYQKDIKQSQKYYKDKFQSGPRERKNTVHGLVEKIIQGNEEIKVIFTLNPYIPYTLNSDILHENVIDRDKLARNNF